MEKGWTLTVCLIVKNEEHCLGDCLDSIKEWADQIVVVDTGSTDHTVQVAKRYNAQVEFFQWKNDFAQARNYGLQFAVGDWILVLDADECLEGDLMALADLVTKDYEGYYLTIKSPLGIGEVEAEDHVVRFFRNRQEYRFCGAIHEQIAGSIKACKGEAAIAFSGMVVRHSGYLPDEISRKQKMKRNSRIIRSQLAGRQDDTFMLYSLGTELIQQQQYGEAGDVLEKALRHMTGGEGYFREVVVLALMAGLKNRAYGEKADLFAKALNMMPADKDILFLAGLRQAFQENYHAAGELFVQGGIDTVLAPPNLVFAITGEAFFRQQSWPEAARYFTMSLEAASSLYSAVRLMEMIRQGKAGNVEDLADAAAGDYAKLVQEAVQQNDYYAAAVLCLAVLIKNHKINLNQWKDLYQAAISQAGGMPAVLKDYLVILYQQIATVHAVLAGDPLCRIAQDYLAKTVNKSLGIWLTLWPEHVATINIWECCL